MAGRVFLCEDGFVDITRRQLGRHAAIGTGAFLLPGLLHAATAAAATLTGGKSCSERDAT
jgi:hypothetical protein